MLSKCYTSLCFAISFFLCSTLAVINYAMLQPCWMKPKGLSGLSHAKNNPFFDDLCGNETSATQIEDAGSNLCIISLFIVLMIDLIAFMFGWLLRQLFMDCRARIRSGPIAQHQMVKYSKRRMNIIFP